MRSLALCVGLCILASAAVAGSPTQDYLAARDRSIARFRTEKDADGRKEALAIKALLPMLRRLVGSPGVPGMSDEGAPSFGDLSAGTDFGKLDGLAVASADGSASAVVTTQPLLTAWLSGHRVWWKGQKDNPPADIATAFRREGFYTQAVGRDAAANLFGELPVSGRTGDGPAAAVLNLYGQDHVAPALLDQIIVSLVRNGRVYIVSRRLAAPIVPIAACETAWQSDQRAVKSAFATFSASQPRDDALFAKYTKLDDESDRRFRRCFQEKLPAQSYYPALTREAQATLDSLP